MGWGMTRITLALALMSGLAVVLTIGDPGVTADEAARAWRRDGFISRLFSPTREGF